MVQFDFASIQARLIQNLQATNSWANLLITGVNQNLIDSIAQEMAYNMNGQEKYTVENWWSKARNKSSLLVESPALGFVVPRKKGAVGTLRLSTDANLSKIGITNPAGLLGSPADIPLSQYFQFSNGSTYVCLNSPLTISQGTKYIDVLVTQGRHVSLSFLSQGIAWETKIIQETSLDNSNFNLYINNILWTPIDTLFSAGPTDKVYQIILDASLTFFTLKFGNGVFGQQLNLNDSIVLNYISTDGDNGNIISTSNVTTVVDQAYTSAGVPIEIYCLNTTGIVGGANYPSLENIRSTAPKVFQSGDRASSINDYTVIISKFNYVGKVNVWGALEYNIDHNLLPWQYLQNEQNLVHLALLGAGPTYAELTPLQQAQLVSDLHGLADPTDIISFEPVEIIHVFFVVHAYLQNSSYVIPAVASNIATTLQSTYGISNMNFNENIYNSDVQVLLDGIPGVKYHNTSMFIAKFKNFDQPWQASFVLSVHPVLWSSLKIYINSVSRPNEWNLVALADGSTASGSTTIYFVGQPLVYNGVAYPNQVWDISTDTNVDTGTGKGVLVIHNTSTIFGGDTYSDVQIKVVYTPALTSLGSTNSTVTTASTQLANPNLILTSRSQIFDYDADDTTITVSYATN